MKSRIASIVCAILAAAALAGAAERELTFDERVEITRGLTAEYATVKTFIPRSKKALPLELDATWDKETWDDAAREHGPAARVGDLVQITKINIEKDRIEFEINGGFKGGRKWYERIEVGMGTRTSPIGQGAYSPAPGGTKMVLMFRKRIPPIQSAEIKKLLAPILDFEKRTATEQYVESLPEEVKAAIAEERAVEGMDKEAVMLALGRPRHKVRESKEGVELEDWIYGEPPGKITFVTFNGEKVVQVRESYAGLGGVVKDPLSPQR